MLVVDLYNEDEDHWYESKRVNDLKRAYVIALQETPNAVLRVTGYAVSEFLAGILPALLDMCMVQAAATTVGALIGGIGGAFAGGVGAVPGAIEGAAVGFSLSATIMGYLGLAFLFVAVGKNLSEVTGRLRMAVKLAWDASDYLPDARHEQVRQAGRMLAEAMAVIVLLILQAIVAWLLKKGMDKLPELVAELRESKLGKGFAKWVEENAAKLYDDPKLRPKRAESTTKAAAESEAQSPSQLAKRGAAEEEAASAAPKTMPEKKVPCFNAANMPAAKVPEFDRQLAGQQKGLNDMTVDEYLKGRDAFSSASRDPMVAKTARADYEDTLAKDIAKQLRDGGMSARAADAQAAQDAAKQMQTLAGLHNPDLVAGGKDLITDFGDKKVNSSIGNQWNNSLGKAHPEWDGNKANSRLKALDDAAKKVPESERATTKMNAKLERFK